VMSVLSYLNKRASEAVLSGDETTSINTSISTLQSRLNSYFVTEGDGLKAHFRFGSSTRGTILPRSMDAHSDIDYMIAFEKGGFNPQTYLDRLKRFAEKKYGSSEIFQSSPTVVLELNHIKFDLVPALQEYGNSYSIPKGSESWQTTNPNDFNASLEKANKDHSYQLKPTIRLAKLWNAQSGYVFDSYSFEKWIVDNTSVSLFVSNQTDYLFRMFDNLPSTTDTQWRTDKLKYAKELVAEARKWEKEGMLENAERTVKKLIKE
jgi:hypothetical protein